MALSIFSNFDDHNKVLLDDMFSLQPSVWVIMLFFQATFSSTYWMRTNYLELFWSFLKMHGYKIVMNSMFRNMGGSASMITSIMTLMYLLSWTGSVTNTFSITSQLSLNFSVALILWTTIMILSISYNPFDYILSLQPKSSPTLLNPFLSTVETVSSIIRPITLTVRITANLSTGHILLGLVGKSYSNVSPFFMAALSTSSTCYCMYELSVMYIQSYVFITLPTLYSNEHPNTNDTNN